MGGRTREGYAENQRTYRTRKRAAGLCAYGGCSHTSAHWFCPLHQNHLNALQRARYKNK